MDSHATYLCLAHTLDQGAALADSRLAGCSERHKVALDLPGFAPAPDPLAELGRIQARGLVLCLEAGWPGLFHLRLACRALRKGYAVYVYWPAEQAVEVVDEERLRSFRLHWWVIKLFSAHWAWARMREGIGRSFRATRSAIADFLRGLRGLFTAPLHTLRCLRDKAVNRLHGLRRLYLLARGVALGNDESVPVILRAIADQLPGPAPVPPVRGELAALGRSATPVPFPATPRPSASAPLPAPGLYLRTDFWAPLTSGGSYGHTCHVARELARTCRDLLCLMACRYPLLDAMGLPQAVPAPPGEHGNELNILRANAHYEPLLRMALESLRPAFVYERLCLGNYLGAKLCADLRIPYLAEYNGSEISMKRSFSGEGYEFEDIYLAAEDMAFNQATAVNVVSKWVKKDLVQRGVPAAKILVNPNGVATDIYCPAEPSERRAVRAGFGWDDRCVVAGFIGTFGGWHGVDVLAQALPRLCAKNTNLRFLLIGDGNFKPLVDAAVTEHGLQDRVAMTGRVPQEEGVRLLQACDLLLSPHNSHMVDNRFFGSPTKVFEYMAMGAGIVASDLEQIGEVLSPALRAADLAGGPPRVADQRAVLCTPGDLEEFVEAVSLLAAAPEVAAALGANARRAAQEIYSWERHVDRLWRFVAGEDPAALAAEAGVSDWSGPEDDVPAPAPAKTSPAPAPAKASSGPAPRLETGDAYKDQVQAQWDQDPCGSHYVKQARGKTLEWFLEAEQYRYGTYAPWMPEVMEFADHPGEKVLEVGGGMGADLARFARHGAEVTDYDLSQGHLALARENFALRGLRGTFLHGDAERLPFADNTFDLVYSNGVIHHTPNTRQVVREMLRVLKPGGRAIVMVYARDSKHYWKNLVYDEGVKKGWLRHRSMGDIMSEVVEISEAGARPLVKVYTRRGLARLFADFTIETILQRQMIAAEVPDWARWMSLAKAGERMGWNLIIKARKPAP